MRLTLALCLLGCAADVAPRTYQGASERHVSEDLIAKAVRDVEECVGRPVRLNGWEIRYAAGPYDDKGRFVCDIQPEIFADCGPLPVGCSREEDCPCMCHGLTVYSRRLVVVSDNATGRDALKHEIIHAGLGVADHSAPEFLCQ